MGLAGAFVLAGAEVAAGDGMSVAVGVAGGLLVGVGCMYRVGRGAVAEGAGMEVGRNVARTMPVAVFVLTGDGVDKACPLGCPASVGDAEEVLDGELPMHAASIRDIKTSSMSDVFKVMDLPVGLYPLQGARIPLSLPIPRGASRP